MASHVGHYSRLAYFAICENEPIARVPRRMERSFRKSDRLVKGDSKLTRVLLQVLSPSIFLGGDSVSYR